MQISIIEIRPPELEFGDDRRTFADPREGLTSAGPFSLRFGKAHKSEVRVGLIGTDTLLPAAQAWYRLCEHSIVTAKSNTKMYVDFPGFDAAFQSKLVVSPRWKIDISKLVARALDKPKASRFDAVLDVYGVAIQKLGKDNNLDVITCCIPPEVIASCWTKVRTLTRVEKKELQKAKKSDASQLSFEAMWGADDTAEELIQRDFRRALKARAMEFNIPIQVATSSLFLDAAASQDSATRAWNSSVALFYKGGGIPWRVRTEGPETCYVGISFHYLRTNKTDLMYSSLAQAFSTEGEGFALKGESVPRGPERNRSAYLSQQQAEKLGSKILSEYRERTGRDPARLVMHKTTAFTDSEREGFNKALQQLPVVEYVNIAPGNFRLVQRSAYPPKRGTLCRINDAATYLFTTGFIPEWKTYPGMHVPVPVRITTDAEVDILRAANDVLALARMNWNTAFDTTGAPITLRFARQVGGIMAEVGQRTPSPSYRFYM
jgi:hypothetical protein